jgi:hypothetical protein
VPAYFHRFRTYRDALSWDDTAACVEISPSAAEPGVDRRYEVPLGPTDLAQDDPEGLRQAGSTTPQLGRGVLLEA